MLGSAVSILNSPWDAFRGKAGSDGVPGSFSSPDPGGSSAPSFLQEDATSHFLLEDGTSKLLLE